MPQLILDDQLNIYKVLRPIEKWITVQRLRDLRPNQLIPDDRVPQILRTLKRPTFVTIDQEFWDKQLCHPDYAILVFSLRDDQQELLPDLLRALFRRAEFSTRARRMGMVARISTRIIQFWTYHEADSRNIVWRPLLPRRGRS